MKLRCRHVRPDGSTCYGWAGADNLCPVHNGRNARRGGHPSRRQREFEERTEAQKRRAS